MNRARFAVAATLVSTTLSAGAAVAGQAATTTSQQPLQSVLAGKKLTPPIRGEAVVEWVEPATKREKDTVVSKITVRNASAGPIARFTINETWYDKSGVIVTGGRGIVNGLLQPGEVQTITIETPWKAGMSGYQRQFAHANGTIKQVKVKSLGAPAATTTAGKPATTTGKKEPAAKPATVKK